MISIHITSGLVACGAGVLFAIFLAKPLYSVLGDACGNDRRASFWTAYSVAMMVLAPAVGVMFLAAFPAHGLSTEVVFARSLFYGVICLIFALLIVGRVIGKAAFMQLDAEIKTAVPAQLPKEY